MRLVDDDERRLGGGDSSSDVGVREPLGRDEQELERVLGEPGERLLALAPRQLELSSAAPSARSRSASTWSRCRAISGETTSVAPAVSSPAIW